MAKIVVAALRQKSKRQPKGSSVTEKRVRSTGGQTTIMRSLDAESRTFGEDFQYVFSKNVAKARRDNKRATGATDVAVPKR
ncbi:hypothetical protein EN978_36325 [Mesorhizobium sp. M7A.F.Ca.US.001.04.1.1]|uniref:hypothetical protein n=1 Tax=unclassified Mesorhizobium TaxID=325217 RepID=UPI000FCA640D|nr:MULTISPECIES: hypothetical protein [unclassified Mesorhizobium]RUY20517.1 hypothetical protein EN979_36185 [Mesorhizobium sp. M7A.F.Ca.US.001.04.2.1]RUY33715.1 hypothetical protein EN978_36325 [Mesorhizobium sp. M7A.F.Ca.US.001.04.1.1]